MSFAALDAYDRRELRGRARCAREPDRCEGLRRDWDYRRRGVDRECRLPRDGQTRAGSADQAGQIAVEDPKRYGFKCYDKRSLPESLSPTAARASHND